MNKYLLAALAFLLFSKKSSATSKKVSVYLLPINSGYGNRVNKITKKKQFHNGIDLAAPLNTPIEAIRSGEVISVNDTINGGLTMRIKLNDGFTIGFAHLNKAALKKGAKFKAGQIVAYSGNSGKLTTGPHLHLTVRDPKGNLINPVPYLRRYH
jgi:murein DD-endopeptidase MepM/ murein hydrolase activator NlpD